MLLEQEGTMGEEKFNEKEEKTEEKELDKHEEKADEKWHQDPLSAVVGALILMWAGVVLLAHNLGILDALNRMLALLPIPEPDLPFDIPFFGTSAWQLFFLGAAGIVICEVIIRLLVPAYRRRVFGSIIGAIVLLALGLGSWNLIWPLVLIAIGASILLSGIFRKPKL
jgi:uncharacterized membrane protein